jgi:hypothetical protein
MMLAALGDAVTFCGAETESVCTATAFANVLLINIPGTAAPTTNNKMSRRERKILENFLIIRTPNSLKIPYANWHSGMAKQHETSPTRPFKTRKWAQHRPLVCSGRPNIKWSFLRTLRKLFAASFGADNAKIPAKNDRDF